jgi:hypothetical protein
MNETTLFSGEIYKLNFSIGSSEYVWTKGQVLEKVGVKITKMVKDTAHYIRTGEDKVLVFAKNLNDGEEYLFDEIKSNCMSIRREK